jgi:hypothetical protein
MMKLFAGLLVLAALAMGAAMVIGGRVPMADNPPSSPATKVLSPSDTFVIHDAAPATPVAPTTPAPSDPNTAPAPGALDAAIDRLRAATPSDPATPAPDATVTITPGPTAAPSTPDPLLAGPSPAPSILTGPPSPPPPPSWTAVTSQGVRWRGSPNSLVIDMGGGRSATVFVDPAFAALPQEAANTRVEFLKQTILENFPPGSSQFRFARDGSVAMLR